MLEIIVIQTPKFLKEELELHKNTRALMALSYQVTGNLTTPKAFYGKSGMPRSLSMNM